MNTGFEATTLLVVKLEAQQWNVVMAALGELPYKHSAPLVQAVMEQLQQQAPAGNGVDHTINHPGQQPYGTGN
jgi:hypothetical protein